MFELIVPCPLGIIRVFLLKPWAAANANDYGYGQNSILPAISNASVDVSIQQSRAAIAQLGERQTEDLKVPGSIPGLGKTVECSEYAIALYLFFMRFQAFIFSSCT